MSLEWFGVSLVQLAEAFVCFLCLVWFGMAALSFPCVACKVTNQEYLFRFSMGRKRGKLKTRGDGDEFLGLPCEIPDTGNLPTFGDVLRAATWQQELNQGKVSNSQAVLNVIPSILAKWNQANPLFSLIPENSIKVRIVKGLDFLKKIRDKKAGLTAQKITAFKNSLQKLFDILRCKCEIFECKENCGQKSCTGLHARCGCQAEYKIPVLELAYIQAERSKDGHLAAMQMGLVDRKEAKRADKFVKRKSKKFKSTVEVDQDSGAAAQGEFMDCADFEMNELPAESGRRRSDTDFEPWQRERPVAGNNWINLQPFIAELERYGVSDAAGAAIYNSVLTVHGLITENNRAEIITKTKIKGQRKILRSKRKEEVFLNNFGGLECVGTDGKRDKNAKKLVQEVINGECVTKKKVGVQEHLSYTREPPGCYLTHTAVPPNKGTGFDLGQDLLEVLAENNSKESLLAVLCDGTATNTGWKTGMIVTVERELKVPLLWLVCQLHGNELPFRHEYELADGGHGTSGPNSFKGPLGSSVIGDIYLLPVTEFEPVPSVLPEFTFNVLQDLSNDQRLLYLYSKAVSEGSLSQNLAEKIPGPVCHARWLTFALRFLVIYTRTETPCQGLKDIVTYIQTVYVPAWFEIKINWKFTSGPSNILKTIQLVGNLPDNLKPVAKKFVQSNAYFSDPAMIVTAALASDESHHREFAVKILRENRKKPHKKPKLKLLKGMRKFEIPQLNWEATDWHLIIDWSKVKLHETRNLQRLTEEDLCAALISPVKYPDFPCHSQSVERCVKLVSEVTKKIFGEENQKASILSIQSCRKSRPAFNSKKEYVVQ